MSFQTQVSINQQFDVSTETLWKIIREFGRADQYVAAIKECKLRQSEENGTVRYMVLEGDATAAEKLDVLDDENKLMSYTLLETTLPVARYSSTMKLQPVGDNKCELHWTAQMSPRGISEDEIKEMIMGLYTMGIDGLNKLISKN